MVEEQPVKSNYSGIRCNGQSLYHIFTQTTKIASPFHARRVVSPSFPYFAFFILSEKDIYNSSSFSRLRKIFVTKYSFVDIRFNREIINYAVLRGRRFIILKDTGEYVYDYLLPIARTTILSIARL